MARLTLLQLKQKRYTHVQLTEEFERSLGNLVDSFVMLIFGDSGNGKTNFILQMIRVLVESGTIAYISLEERFSYSIHRAVSMHLGDVDEGVMFYDEKTTINELKDILRKQRAPKYVFIDSIQYWGINIEDYKALKEEFTNVGFIFVSHEKNQVPLGKMAQDIRYDADVKIHVKKFIAFVTSRFGGGMPYCIYEQRARQYWGVEFDSIMEGNPPSKTRRVKKGGKND